MNLWAARPDKGVPAIRYAPAGNATSANIVHLTEDGPLAIGTGAEYLLEIDLANGGGATMPCLLMLSKTQLDVHPVT